VSGKRFRGGKKSAGAKKKKGSKTIGNGKIGKKMQRGTQKQGGDAERKTRGKGGRPQDAKASYVLFSEKMSAKVTMVKGVSLGRRGGDGVKPPETKKRF